jgi:hypothetical protein
VHDLDDPVLLDSDVFVLRVGTDLYLQYNRAKGYNRDTDVPDTVTVTYALAATAVSHRLAALAAGETYVYRDGNYSVGQERQRWIVIAVCELTKSWEGQVDYAIVSIHAGRDTRSGCPVEPLAPNVTNGTRQPTVWYNSTGNSSSPPSRSPLLDDSYDRSTTLSPSAWMDKVHAPIDNTATTNQDMDAVSATLWTVFAALALCLVILGGYAYRWNVSSDHRRRAAAPPCPQRTLVCCGHESKKRRCHAVDDADLSVVSFTSRTEDDVHPTRPDGA